MQKVFGGVPIKARAFYFLGSIVAVAGILLLLVMRARESPIVDCSALLRRATIEDSRADLENAKKDLDNLSEALHEPGLVEPPQPKQLSTRLRDARQSLRSLSPLQTHAYDKKSSTEYLGILNAQLIAVQAISLMAKDFSRIRADLLHYNAVMDQCLILARCKNSDELKRCQISMHYGRSAIIDYYVFLEGANSLEESQKNETKEIVSEMIAPMIEKLSALADTAASKEQFLVNFK